MACWMNLGQTLKVNAKKFPRTVALKDNVMLAGVPMISIWAKDEPKAVARPTAQGWTPAASAVRSNEPRFCGS